METKKNKLSDEEKGELKLYRLLKQLSPEQVDGLITDLLSSPQLNDFTPELVDKITPYDVEKIISAESGITLLVHLVKVTGERTSMKKLCSN
jgi:hypothetical protein